MTRTIIRDLFYGIIIFTLVLVGGVSMMSIFNDSNADYTSDSKFSEFNASMNTLTGITSKVEILEEGITQDPEGDVSLLGVLGNLINGAWNTLSVLIGGFGFMGTAFTGLSMTFGIPLWITGLLSLIITVLLIFVLYSALFQREI